MDRNRHRSIAQRANVRETGGVPRLSYLPYAPECVERLSGNSYARAKRLTISRVIAA